MPAHGSAVPGMRPAKRLREKNGRGRPGPKKSGAPSMAQRKSGPSVARGIPVPGSLKGVEVWKPHSVARRRSPSAHTPPGRRSIPPPAPRQTQPTRPKPSHGSSLIQDSAPPVLRAKKPRIRSFLLGKRKEPKENHYFFASTRAPTTPRSHSSSEVSTANTRVNHGTFTSLFSAILLLLILFFQTLTPEASGTDVGHPAAGLLLS